MVQGTELIPLQTAAEVVEMLGGPAKVGRLTRRSSQAACNWKAAGKIPPEFYFVINEALRPHGRSAPKPMFGIVPPQEESEDALCGGAR